MTLVKNIYRETRGFPREEAFGLTSQMRRCAISIPSNIAEGYGRQQTGDYIRFLRIARGSLFELQTQLEIATDLAFLSKEAHEPLESQAQEIAIMLSSLISKLNKKV